MKANELRIGNSVDWDDKTIRSIVKGIHPSGKYLHLENGWIDLIRCEPIPITEEWLVKFGFTTKNKVDFESNCGIIDLEATDAGYLFDSRIVIKHVHQLQNLYFALTGEEL